MHIRNWLGIAVGAAQCVRFLPISAKAQYFLGISLSLVALVLAVMWLSDEHRKDPEQGRRIMFFMIGILALILALIVGIPLVIQNAPK